VVGLIDVLIIYKQLKRKVLSEFRGVVTGHRYLGLGALDCTAIPVFLTRAERVAPEALRARKNITFLCARQRI
jgi:hypothetical protein